MSDHINDREFSDQTLSSLALVSTPNSLRTFAWIMGLSLLAVIPVLYLVPWVQNVNGSGRVVAFAPLERQQSIEAPIEGRIARWHVREGSHVRRGDPIADLIDNDPELMNRLRLERSALRARLDAARARVAGVEARIAALQGSRTNAMSGAGLRSQMALQRLHSAERALEANQAAALTATLQVNRQRTLVQQGLSSQRTVELAELDAARTALEVQRAQNSVDAARSERLAIIADRSRSDTDGTASISDALATRASAEADIATVNVSIAQIEVRLSRQASQNITSPCDGTVLRLTAAQGTEMVKAGDPIATLIPDTQERAVELWVDGNDVPLIFEGRHVRLQFEGWPAVQFSGWPSVSVGTFGGRVALVDATDDGRGKFRVVVVPDGHEPWPAQRYLRQGVRANGWFLLDRVRIGWELWRQFNGFPPAMSTPPSTAPQATRASSSSGGGRY
ncbi:MAG: biotin/lipoyl-binding protein [Deltaproteobacteria bacterium]|nr:biotin/lipoyl-binding protein [Deltaproteobacteria bacterium]